MNQKIKQLQTLVYLEEQKVSAALLKYSQAKKNHQDLKLQHKMLIDYKEEYNQRLQGEQSNVLNAHTLQIYYNFVAKLGSAIADQSNKAQAANKVAMQLFNDYLKLKQKSEGLEKVLDKEKVAELQRQQKQEQKQLDESAGAQWYQNRKNKE